MMDREDWWWCGGLQPHPEPTPRTHRPRARKGVGAAGTPSQHCLLPLPPHLPGLAGTWSGHQGAPEPKSGGCGCRAYLRHPLRAPQLVDKLVQGVDRQFPAQHQDLGQQVLLQPLHPLHDARTVQVPLRGTRGACRARGAGGRARHPGRGPTDGATRPWAPEDKGILPAPATARCRGGIGVQTSSPPQDCGCEPGSATDLPSGSLSPSVRWGNAGSRASPRSSAGSPMASTMTTSSSARDSGEEWKSLSKPASDSVLLSSLMRITPAASYACLDALAPRPRGRPAWEEPRVAWGQPGAQRTATHGGQCSWTLLGTCGRCPLGLLPLTPSPQVGRGFALL